MHLVGFIVRNLVHNLSYTKSRCLTNIPTRFGARRPQLQEVPSQMLKFQHLTGFKKLSDNVLHDFKVLLVHLTLYCCSALIML